MSDAAIPLVVHVIYRLDVGGLENGVVNLLNRLPRERYRQAVVCLAGYGAEFRERIERSDVEVVSIGKQPGKDPRMYARVWRAFRRLRPAIVHTRNLGTVDLQWVAWAAGARHRVHGEHGWEAADPQGRDPRTLRIRRACRPVIERYVPMSRDLARWLADDVGVAPSRIRQLYNGVDTLRFAPPATGMRDDSTVTVGTVGRLDPVKNQGRLLEAVAALGRRDPRYSQVRVLVVGAGPQDANLRARAEELGLGGRIEFTGASSDTAPLFRRMHVFALPSLNEGISNTILEAMATGLPVVAGRVGGNPELVQEGVTGSLYDPTLPDALERALEPYLAQPSLRGLHGVAGRERAVQHFGLDGMIQRYLDLYDELLQPGTLAAGAIAAGGRGWPRAG